MPDKDALEIKLSKVIPAEKWKVIRLVTKVDEFPRYMPSVKEAKVTQKSGHKMLTKWRVQVDQVPISWVEEDILALREGVIRFKAVEGDLEEFSGEWIFRDHPEGTEVIVNAYLSVGIPAIKEFADLYIKELLTKNFAAILEALERRLISVRYASYKAGDKTKIAGFAALGHFYNFKHMERSLKMINPDFKMPSQEFIGQLFSLTPSFKMHDVLNFKSKTGATTNGRFILTTFIPDMIEKDAWAIFSKVVRACKIAEKYGVGIVALGGFTSIVAERIGHEIASEVDVPITTGNTFTAAMAIEGVLKAAGLLGLDLARLKVAIIGGTGDIGSGCARVFVTKVKQLTITGRSKTNLVRLRAELAKKRKASIIATSDNERAVRDADIIIAAASVSASIVKIDWFKPGAIICDIGYPKNISYTPTPRQDILIFSGGLSKSPTPVSFPVDTGLPARDVLYGCFAEAIILALEKRFENFSFGRGNIFPEKIEEITRLGKKHGFEVSDFYWGDKTIDEALIGKIKESVKA
ncbi:MAG: SRPBCC family protein [Candidatus Omnitrophota bacterium]|jgi:predicted amino acid dehydrogenase/ribosome-associated toxin RatA of RatAB toxin-antitoxin module